MQYSNGIRTQCHVYQYSSLFPVLFLQSLYVPFNSKNFLFTCRILILSQMPPPSVSPPLYEEVDFEPVPRTVGFYDVLRKEDTQEEDDAPIYDLPPDS